MSYIGKEPQTGAYSMLDALTASATASYSLTLDSVAFVPESANHLIVSLNGHIQKAGSSFTVSSSTLTFSSALTSSDSIDFVLALGNVLDIGTPSDATVTNAKTNFVSTSSAAGLQIKGDGTTDGTLQLNCSQNSHGIKLKSPAHSASASYTLTFPTTDGNADEFLKTDGSGVLSWASAGGGAFEKISTTTISSGVSSVDFTTLSTDYRDFRIVISSLVLDTHQEDVAIRVKRSGQSSFDSGSTDYRYANHGTIYNSAEVVSSSNGANVMKLNATNIARDATVDGATYNSIINAFDVHGTTNSKFFNWSSAYVEGTYGSVAHDQGAGYRYDTSETALIGIQITNAGSTQFTSGTVTLYGRKN